MRYRLLTIASAVVLSANTPGFIASPAQAQDQDRCPAGGSGCTIDNAAERIRDRVNQGVQDVLDNANPQGRVEEVRDTLNDCMECGMDALQEGMDRITDPNSSDSSDSSSDSETSSDPVSTADASPE